MRYSFTLTALSLLSSAFAITVTAPSSDTVWDFSTPKTIKFTSDPSDPPVISIILRTQDGSFQTKLADNVKTSDGEYTTQPNPSISNGNDYEIQIIDSAGQLAVSAIFTAEKGASDDGTASSSSSNTSSSTSSFTTSSFSSSTSSATTIATTSTSVISILISSASPAPTSSTSPLSSSGKMQLRIMLGDHTNTSFFIAGSTTSTSTSSSSSSTSFSTSSSTATSSNASDTSSTSPSVSALPSTGAASSLFGAPKEAMALLGATFALFYV
ncbi:uncharacterized protein N7479_006058 [Penicillium vulpinum]|uniref:Yeast cell wall synthesis Kre9/Knh1-like N-terminal domain-containing protein n=1 Tax=Penicillium vulpinum TaxID=29845 RepID=A0A1V6SF30_9EURO|nr:uncharacterized protein N7479_006058 [Penicillium vulpinum]KAJ5958908.1 hypothetical protein N7479_006058 [Penicillium vulpinum]OQE12369.1 hypothetical protein PENVUL_c001G08617 [Penicillium vulpinum]